MTPWSGNCQFTGTARWLTPADVLIDKPDDRAPRGFLEFYFVADVKRPEADSCVTRPFIPADEIDDAGLRADLGLHEWLEEPVQAGRLQVPVGDQHALPLAARIQATFASAIVRPVPPLNE